MVFQLLLVLAALLLALRAICVLPSKDKHPNLHLRTKKHSLKAMAVLGSGGHTTEMVQILKGLGLDYFKDIICVFSKDDRLSTVAFRSSFNHKSAKFIAIPRARRVGQSYFSSVGTTLYAFIYSLYTVFSETPDIILCNGPAICVPIVVASYCPRVLGLKYPSIVYIESFARVKSLSLSGKLLYPLSDRFVVQWEHLKQKYPKSEHHSYLV